MTDTPIRAASAREKGRADRCNETVPSASGDDRRAATEAGRAMWTAAARIAEGLTTSRLRPPRGRTAGNRFPVGFDGGEDAALLLGARELSYFVSDGGRMDH